MKKTSLLLLLVILTLASAGCSRSVSVEPDPPECPYCSSTWQREDFVSHLRGLSDDPEDSVDVGLKYNRTKDLEDASTKLYCYIYGDAPVSWNEADDAWEYVFSYIDALHAEIDELYREYDEAY